MTCPEGTHPRKVRFFNRKRFALNYGIFFVAYGPISMAAPFLGLMLGGATGAYIGVFMMATPGTGVLFSLVLAGLTGIPWLGNCQCAAELCEYSEENDACILKEQEGSTNPYKWLPYMGSKCAPVPSSVKPVTNTKKP